MSGWTENGMSEFNRLWAEVKAERESAQGKAFEKEYQDRMMSEGGQAINNKRKAVMEIKVNVTNDLDSDGEGQ
jgi:hypothetical protein